MPDLTETEERLLEDAINEWVNRPDAATSPYDVVESIVAARREADAQTIRGLRERYERLRADVAALADQANDEAQTRWYRHNEAADDGDLDRANFEGGIAEALDQTRSALRATLARHEAPEGGAR